MGPKLAWRPDPVALVTLARTMGTPHVKEPAESPTRLERAGDLAARAGSLQPSDPTVRRGLHASIGIIVVLSVGLAAVAAVGDFPDVDWRFRPAALLLAVVLIATYLLVSSEIWRRLLHALGPTLTPLRAESIWFASGLGRYVPTALLLPMLRMAMAERYGVPKRITFATIVYEIALFFAGSLIVSAYFVITLPDLQGEWQRFLVLVIPVIAVVVLQPRIFHTIADKVLLRLGRRPLPLSLPGPRVFEFLFLYAADTIIAGFGLYFLTQSVYPAGTGDLPTIVGSYAVANTFSILAFILPGGLGAREAGMTVALSPVIPTAPALAIAVLSRVLQLGLEVILALLTPVLARRREARSPAPSQPEALTG
jgi:glycosyltransferase 2 family protein